jgi:hypothetical protein
LPLLALLMPPEKLVNTSPTRIPECHGEIIPLLVMPPPLLLLPKTATLLTKMPSPKAVSLPLLLMPPVKLPTFLETSIAALLTEMAPYW